MKYLKKIFPIYTKQVTIALVGMFILLVVTGVFFLENESIEEIERPNFFENNKNIKLYYEDKQEKGIVNIKINNKGINSVDEKKYINEVKKDLEEGILAEHDSYKTIKDKIRLPENYRNCEIEYFSKELDKKGFFEPINEGQKEISIEYKIKFNKFTSEGKLILIIKAEAIKKEYLKKYKKEKIETSISIQNKNNKIETIILPKDTTFYTKISNFNFGKIIGVFILIIIIVSILLYQEKKEREEEEINELNKQMTSLINNFIMMYQTGLTIGKSFEIALKNRLEVVGDESEVFEKLKKIYKTSNEGISVYETMDIFAKEFRTIQAKRFVRLILQNLRQGDSFLLYQLEQMSKNLWEERLRVARKKSEKAGSKLIFPMLLIFVVIMILSIVPTFLQVGNSL